MLGVILLAGVLLWLFWPRAEERAPQPATVSADSPIPPSVGVLTQAPLQPPIGLLDSPWVRITATADQCAVCQSTRSARFITSRIVLCQWCVSLLSTNAPIDVQDIYGRIRACVPPHTPLEGILNGRVMNQSIARVLAPLFGQGHSMDWRRYLRAYYLGLISHGPRPTRPKETEWAMLSNEIRRLDGRICRICKQKNRGELHVHHIIPLAEWGTNNPANLVTLCYTCHRWQHPGILFALDEKEAR